MKKTNELRLKPIKDIPTNELSAFINTIYDNFFHQITNLEDSLKNENEPLHYLLTKIRLDETRNALKMFERVVDDCTKYKEVEVSKDE